MKSVSSSRRISYALILALTLLFRPLASYPQSSSRSTTDTGAASKTKPKQPTNPACTDNGSYVNSQGKTVKRPENCSSTPQGATAQCRDGSYSFSQNRRGTCSHHGGVAKWL